MAELRHLDEAACAELQRERQALVRADKDIVEGQARVDRQSALIAEMRAKNLDPSEGERLLDLLGDALAQWEKHRQMIVERISYLEAKLRGSAHALPPSGPCDPSVDDP